jgi:phosphoenolpyruvate synthase/pyruvate phosphate dikinase
LTNFGSSYRVTGVDALTKAIQEAFANLDTTKAVREAFANLDTTKAIQETLANLDTTKAVREAFANLDTTKAIQETLANLDTTKAVREAFANLTPTVVVSTALVEVQRIIDQTDLIPNIGTDSSVSRKQAIVVASVIVFVFVFYQLLALYVEHPEMTKNALDLAGLISITTSITKAFTKLAKNSTPTHSNDADEDVL